MLKHFGDCLAVALTERFAELGQFAVSPLLLLHFGGRFRGGIIEPLRLICLVEGRLEWPQITEGVPYRRASTKRGCSRARQRLARLLFRFESDRRLPRAAFDFLQDAHHQIFPKPASIQAPLENQPQALRIALGGRRDANRCEIVAKPMRHCLHLLGAVGRSPYRIDDRSIQVNAGRKPCFQRFRFFARAAGRSSKR